MSNAVRRGARPAFRVAPAAVCLLAGVLVGACSSTSSAPPVSGQLSRDQWAQASVAMLRGGLHLTPGDAQLVLPAAQAGDSYTAALAVLGAGDRAAALVQAAGADLVRERFREAVKPAQLATSVAGPVSGAATILRADRAVPLLDPASLSSLRAVLDSALSARSTDVFVAADAVDLATMLDHRVGDARAWLAAALQASPPGCVGTESLYAVGAASTRGGATGCTPEQMRSLVEAQTAALSGAVGVAGHPGLAEAEGLLALARISSTDSAVTGSARAQLAALVASLDRAILEGRAADLTPVAADLATTASLLGLSRPVPDVVLGHLTVVLRGNGEAQTSHLGADGVALAVRVRRALGETSAHVEFSAPDPQGQLELLLAHLPLGATPDPATVAAGQTLMGRVELGSPTGMLLALRAANSLGAAGCSARAVTDAAGVLVTSPRPATGAEDLRRALAWRLLRGCGSAPSEDTRRELLSRASATLAAVAPGPSRPSLIEATRAAAVACALEPATLSSVDMWKAFGDDALPGGGVADPHGAFTDLEATYDLAVLSATDRTSCTQTGQLG